MPIDAHALREMVQAQRPMVERFFDVLFSGSADTEGVTRDSYGAGENFAHQLFADFARQTGLEVRCDLAANTHATWAGRDRVLPRILTGSHLDSVRRGGNFDGAAGVVAGLAAISALKAGGMQPARDITVMGVRAEESIWFQTSYVGSRAALGTLPPGALELKRVDTGRSLRDHMAACGADPDAIRAGRRSIDPADVSAFLEVHIEQAPSLVHAGLPVAICTAVPGNFRYPAARIYGEHGHVGTPRPFRRDAVMAAADFAQALDRLWEEYHEADTPMACTMGRFHTDTSFHGLTNVPGLFHFSLDVRGYEEELLRDLENRILDMIAGVEKRKGVKFDLGPRTCAPVAKADPAICRAFDEAARRLDISAMPLGSPGSHDSAAFAEAGVPMAMLLVRNRNGSHNPAETMDIGDFLDAVSILALWLSDHAMHSGD